MSEIPSKDFIMLPKIDFAFKEMMSDETARNGFLQAVLGAEIKHSELMNTNLDVKHEDEKFSICALPRKIDTKKL